MRVCSNKFDAVGLCMRACVALLLVGQGRLPGCDTDMEGNGPKVPQCDAELTHGCGPCLPSELNSGRALWGRDGAGVWHCDTGLANAQLGLGSCFYCSSPVLLVDVWAITANRRVR